MKLIFLKDFLNDFFFFAQGCRSCAMAECSFARCQQERRAIRKELQRWTKNMVYILGECILISICTGRM